MNAVNLVVPAFTLVAMGCGVMVAWTVVREELTDLKRRVDALENDRRFL